MAPKQCVGIFNGLTPTKVLETQFQVFNITLPSQHLETAVLTSVYCFVLWCGFFLCSVCVLHFSDKFHVRLFVQQNLWTYETI
jgi:hypothetical protein